MKKRKKDLTPPRAGAHTVREGSVQSIGGRPSGRDMEDRTGEGEAPGTDAPRGSGDEGRSPDAFVSSEVSDMTSTPGRDTRTRS